MKLIGFLKFHNCIHNGLNQNTTFSVTTYQQQLADFLYNTHDWNSETTSFKNDMISYFGADWKRKTAEAFSWMGLTKTDQYVDYINSLPPTETLAVDQIAREREHIENANSNCN